MSDPALSVVVPLFQEAHCLADHVRRMLDDLRSFAGRHELILVDDGSVDDTLRLAGEIAAEHEGVRVLHHTPNQGKGYTVRQGVLASRGAEVLLCDADLSTPISELGRLRAAALQSGAEVAIGSRALARSQLLQRQPWPREAAGRLGNLAIRVLSPTLRGLRDTQCGFKLFGGPLARRVFAAARVRRWGFDFEVLTIAAGMGATVVEVPVSWSHDPHSKVTASDYLRTLADLVHVRARELRGAYPRSPGPP